MPVQLRFDGHKRPTSTVELMISVAGNLLIALARVVFLLVMLSHVFLSIGAIHNNLGILLLTIRSTPSGIIQTLFLLIGSVAPILLAFLYLGSIVNIGKRHVLVHGLAILVTFCYVITTVLLSYRIRTGLAADPFLLWYHFRDALRTVTVLSHGHAFLSVTILAITLCFYRVLV